MSNFIAINCDMCGRIFEDLIIPCDEDPFITDEIISDLERAAANSGWFYYREEHRCTSCLLNTKRSLL